MYSLVFTDVAVTAQQDLFQVEPATNACTIYAVYISQRSDVGDAAAESLSIVLRTATDEVTDDAVPERPLDAGTSAFTGDTAINETTELTTGPIVYHSEMWNIALPFVWLPPPEMRIVVPVGVAFLVNLNTTPTDELTMSGTIYFGQKGS
jgi:hypothetical protein